MRAHPTFQSKVILISGFCSTTSLSALTASGSGPVSTFFNLVIFSFSLGDMHLSSFYFYFIFLFYPLEVVVYRLNCFFPTRSALPRLIPVGFSSSDVRRLSDRHGLLNYSRKTQKAVGVWCVLTTWLFCLLKLMKHAFTKTWKNLRHNPTCSSSYEASHWQYAASIPTTDMAGHFHYSSFPKRGKKDPWDLVILLNVRTY